MLPQNGICCIELHNGKSRIGWSPWWFKKKKSCLGKNQLNVWILWTEKVSVLIISVLSGSEWVCDSPAWLNVLKEAERAHNGGAESCSFTDWMRRLFSGCESGHWVCQRCLFWTIPLTLFFFMAYSGAFDWLWEVRNVHYSTLFSQKRVLKWNIFRRKCNHCIQTQQPFWSN